MDSNTKGLDISPATMTAKQIRKAFPVGGMVVLAVEHDGGVDSDTVTFNPEWIAMLLKQVRQGESETISLRGCLLPNSPELKGENQYLQDETGIAPEDWQNWLLNKPEEEIFESATVCEGGLSA